MYTKIKYVGIEHLELGAYDAVANFNIGRKPSVVILEGLNIVQVQYPTRGCIKSNKKRFMFAAINKKKEVQAGRKFHQGLKKKNEDREIDLEG